MAGDAWGLAQPAGFFPTEGGGDGQKIDFPFGVKSPPPFAPSQIPVPDLREDHHRKGQQLRVNATALNLALGRGREGTKPQPEMLNLLRGGLCSPDPIPLQSEGREGGGLEG